MLLTCTQTHLYSLFWAFYYNIHARTCKAREKPDSDRSREMLGIFSELQHCSIKQCDKLWRKSNARFITHMCSWHMVRFMRYGQPFKKNRQGVSAVGHSSFSICFINSFLTSSPLLRHHGFHWEIWAGESRQVRGVSGSDRYMDFLYWCISHQWITVSHRSVKSLSNLCHRVPQCQDRPQGGYRGASGWGRLHLDANHSQLDLVQQVQRWSGMWAGDNDGLQIQGEFITGSDHKMIVSQQSWRMFTTCHEAFMQAHWTFPSVAFCPCNLQAPVTMEGGKISIQFPQYHFTAELIEDKLVMVREATTSHVQNQQTSDPNVLTETNSLK